MSRPEYKETLNCGLSGRSPRLSAPLLPTASLLLDSSLCSQSCPFCPLCSAITSCGPDFLCLHPKVDLVVTLSFSIIHSALYCLFFGLVYFIFCPPGTQDQPMEESYEEAVVKVIEQEWTCLGSQQLPCWTVMEDMPRM